MKTEDDGSQARSWFSHCSRGRRWGPWRRASSTARARGAARSSCRAGAPRRWHGLATRGRSRGITGQHPGPPGHALASHGAFVFKLLPVPTESLRRKFSLLFHVKPMSDNASRRQLRALFVYCHGRLRRRHAPSLPCDDAQAPA